MARRVAEPEDVTAADDLGAIGTRRRVLVEHLDVVLLAIVVVAVFLRFWRLGAQSIWYDEYVTTRDTAHGLGSMLFSTLGKAEGTPPLYFILQWGWVRVFGYGDAAVRSLSAVVGVATVPVVYAIARRLGHSTRIARVAALLVAVNPLFVWYSQEARSYSLLVFLVSVSLLFCVRAVDTRQTSDLVLWGVASAAALATHYLAALILVPEAIWLLRRFRDWKRVAIGCVPIVVVAVPLVAFAEIQSEKHNWIADFPLGLRLADAGRQLVLGVPEPLDKLWPLTAALVLVPIALVVLRGRSTERMAAATMVALVAGGLVLALALSVFGLDLVLGRYLIGLTVPLLIAAAIGLGARRAGALGIAATLVLCGLWTGLVVDAATNTSLHKPDWRAVSKVLATGGGDRLVVIDDYLGQPIVRYWKQVGVADPGETMHVRRIDLLYHVANPARRCGRFSGLACEVFFFPNLPNSLQQQFPLVGRVNVDGFIVNRYEAPEPVAVRPGQLLTHGRRDGTVLFTRDT